MAPLLLLMYYLCEWYYKSIQYSTTIQPIVLVKSAQANFVGLSNKLDLGTGSQNLFVCRRLTVLPLRDK